MIKHRYIITDRGDSRIGEIVNYTEAQYSKERNTWGSFQITVDTNHPEARLGFVEPLLNNIQYYRTDENGVETLEWEGVCVNDRHITDNIISKVTYTFYGHLWRLSRRKDDFVFLDTPASTIISESLQKINDFYDTGIRMGTCDIDYNFDREEYDITFEELLRTFGELGFEYEVKRDSEGVLRLNVMQSLGEAKIDESGNPTFTLYNGTGGTLQSWEHQRDATEFANQITGLGAGSGVAQIRYTETDFASREKYGLYQMHLPYSDAETEGLLIPIVQSDLVNRAVPVDMFDFDLTHGTYDFKSFKHLDTIFVSANDKYRSIQKFVKIAAISVTIPQRGFEKVSLTINVLL